jgi:DNA invertase Pin-like site-specific DNA recombinase
MASNQNAKNSKSAKRTNEEYNNNNNMHPPQMMGWMPPYQQVGGWMPPPGMQPYHPQMMGWMQPQYPPNWGWMLPPGMQQPMQQHMQQPMQQPARGFAPSHNGNIQDVVSIAEIEDEHEETMFINHNANARAAVASAIESDDDNDEDKPLLPKSMTKYKVSEPRAQSKQKQENQLAKLFDNALDNNMQGAQQREDYYAEFGQESDKSNVITQLKPVNSKDAHFDNTQFPNELYNAVMINGEKTKLSAENISSNALETGKIVYEYNNQLAKQLAASGKQSAGKAFIYVRSSRTNDISIETQRKACLKYSAEHKLELLPFGYQSDNNISARNMGNLKHELGFWMDHIPDDSHVIIYSVDRLSRNLIKGMQFLDDNAARGIRIHFVTHELVFHSGISAAGRAMIQQELQSAEKFSNIASEKIRTTMIRLRQEGHVFGRAPYGYKHTMVGNIRKRTPDNKEQQNISKIQSQYSYIMDNWKNNPETADLRYSKMNMLRVLVRWCNRNGLKYRNQKNYTTAQLRNIIQMKVDNN